MLGVSRGVFETLNLTLFLQGKNTIRINNYDPIDCFMAMLGLQHCRVQTENSASFFNLGSAFEKNHIHLQGNIKESITTQPKSTLKPCP